MPDERKELGKKGEQIAVEYLLENGYEIVERNFRIREGEIDIIAKKCDVHFFIEVKTRRHTDYRQEYSETQKERMRSLAELYVMKNNIKSQLSFAVLGITGDPKDGDYEIEMLEDNF